jgi:hypothetical protein
MVRPMTSAGREDALIVSLPLPPLTVRKNMQWQFEAKRP